MIPDPQNTENKMHDINIALTFSTGHWIEKNIALKFHNPNWPLYLLACFTAYGSANSSSKMA